MQSLHLGAYEQWYDLKWCTLVSKEGQQYLVVAQVKSVIVQLTMSKPWECHLFCVWGTSAPCWLPAASYLRQSRYPCFNTAASGCNAISDPFCSETTAVEFTLLSSTPLSTSHKFKPNCKNTCGQANWLLMWSETAIKQCCCTTSASLIHYLHNYEEQSFRLS